MGFSSGINCLGNSIDQAVSLRVLEFVTPRKRATCHQSDIIRIKQKGRKYLDRSPK